MYHDYRQQTSITYIFIQIQLCSIIIHFVTRKCNIANPLNSPMHSQAVVVFIVIEIYIRLAMSFIDVVELISIDLSYHISIAIRTESSSITGLVVEAASNVGMNLVVVSLINIR